MGTITLSTEAAARDGDARNGDLLDLMVAFRTRREPHALATVVEVTGSTSASPGAKALIDGAGRVVAGWVGGGCAESMTCQAAVDSIGEGRPRMIDLDMDDEVLGTGMPCGGAMRVFVEPVLPKPTLWILGHGRIAECLCGFGARLGFRVVVDDTLADRAKFPDAAEILDDDLDYARLTPGPSDCVIVATQHKGDHLSTVRALRASAGHVAVIASRKRARLVLDFLRQQGFAREDIAKVRAPAGLDLGGRAPEEVALSVLAEVVMLRHRGTGAPLFEGLP